MNDESTKGGHDYVVGFGRPPKGNQFQPGQSGNPSGRRKPKLTDAEMVAKVRDERVSLKIGGKVAKVTLLEAAIRATINKTLTKGSPRELESLLRILDKYGALPEEVRNAQAKAQATAAVQKIIDIFERTTPADPPEVDAARERGKQEMDMVMACPCCGPTLRAKWDNEEIEPRYFTPLRQHIEPEPDYSFGRKE